MYLDFNPLAIVYSSSVGQQPPRKAELRGESKFPYFASCKMRETSLPAKLSSVRCSIWLVLQHSMIRFPLAHKTAWRTSFSLLSPSGEWGLSRAALMTWKPHYRTTVFKIRITFHWHEYEKNLTGTILNLQASFIFKMLEIKHTLYT